MELLSGKRELADGGFYDFTADLNKGDMAYTNEALPAHTDNTYFVSRSREMGRVTGRTSWAR
jgi:hypothetical protein